MPWEGASALVWDAERLRIATDAAGVALWSWDVDTGEIAMDERAHSLWSVPRSERPVTFEDLSARIHPADLNRVRTAFQATRQAMGGYEIDFRILDGSAVRWLSRYSHYLGLTKTRLQHVITAVAINLVRVTDWFAGPLVAKTRVSRFATLQAA